MKSNSTTNQLTTNMKKSIFTKELKVIGKVRGVTGKIIVTMNHSKTTHTGTNNFTHDDYSKVVTTHRIEGYIGDTRIHDVIHLTEESQVLATVKTIEKSMLERMQISADNPDQKTFEAQMAALGFGDRP